MHYLEITELATHIRDRTISPLTATRAQLERIAALDGALHSYAFVMEESALAQAAAAEAEISKGNYRGALHGVPIAIEDLCWTEGVPTAAGMTIYKGFRPSKDATVVRKLKNAGAVLLGKLQLTEGAYSDHHPSVTPPSNPWNAAYWPGISSSGSAVATAAGLCYGAIASDTGGSIRWVAVLPAVVMDYFGGRNVSGIIGAFYTSVALGTLIGPSSAGLLFDITGGYTVPIAASALATLASAAIVSDLLNPRVHTL